MQHGAGTKRAKTPRRKGNRQSKEIPELHSRVALRAYELFVNRGRTHGRDWDDWFRAEQEILSEQMDTDMG